jgi:excisionase family DNA binding protein
MQQVSRSEYASIRPNTYTGRVAEAEFLTVSEVAERLRVGQESVRRWLRQGKLRGVRTGAMRGGWRVPEPEFERFKREGPVR